MGRGASSSIGKAISLRYCFRGEKGALGAILHDLDGLFPAISRTWLGPTPDKKGAIVDRETPETISLTRTWCRVTGIVHNDLSSARIEYSGVVRQYFEPYTLSGQISEGIGHDRRYAHNDLLEG